MKQKIQGLLLILSCIAESIGWFSVVVISFLFVCFVVALVGEYIFKTLTGG